MILCFSRSKYRVAPVLLPWDLDYVTEPINFSGVDPKEQFDQLVSQTSSRRKKHRKARSTRYYSRNEKMFKLPIFNQNNMIITRIDDTHEGAITCVAKLRKIAIASNPIDIKIASKFVIFFT